MRPREVLARSQTPDGQTVTLTREGGHYIIRVGGASLMSSATYGSEQEMARIARECLGDRRKPRVLVGGLGMGFTVRAVLDEFGPDLQVTVAELLPAIVQFSRDYLGELASHPLSDARTTLYEGDVRHAIDAGAWDAILLDVDNGPAALTTESNASLYSAAALQRIARALTPGGVFVLWSASAEPRFEARLKRAGFVSRTHTVRARGKIGKGARHTLFEARVPR
jgi:spermidine synthase